MARGSVKVAQFDISHFTKEIENAQDDVSQQMVDDLRVKSNIKSSIYAKGWENERMGKKVVVLNNSNHAFLANLLEYGHTVANQHGSFSRTKPFPHIRPSFEKFSEKYMEELAKIKLKSKGSI